MAYGLNESKRYTLAFQRIWSIVIHSKGHQILPSGVASDKEITRHCGLPELLEPGDAVMADKGFDIRCKLMLIGVRLNILPFAKKNTCTQTPARDVVSTQLIVSLRIHDIVERAIKCIKQYRILASVMPLTVVNLSNEI